MCTMTKKRYVGWATRAKDREFDAKGRDGTERRLRGRAGPEGACGCSRRLISRQSRLSAASVRQAAKAASLRLRLCYRGTIRHIQVKRDRTAGRQAVLRQQVDPNDKIQLGSACHTSSSIVMMAI